MIYQSSVYCHCTHPEIQVDLYGSFEYQFGKCPHCGAMHIAEQIPIGYNGKHRYVTEIKHTLKSRIMYEIEFWRSLLNDL